MNDEKTDFGTWDPKRIDPLQPIVEMMDEKNATLLCTIELDGKTIKDGEPFTVGEFEVTIDEK